jgi:alginate O-acetyltransferase complex protein AlgI
VVFSSLRFFLFLAGILGLLALPLSQRAKKIILCAGSCLFYAAWDYRYLALLLLISGIDFICAARIDATTDRRHARMWLALSLVTNLGILAWFKYADFFLSNLNGVLGRGHELPLLRVFLPAGISFYTFKSMSYTIDVYRRVIRPASSLLDYAMFVTLFPDLIAGPIVRASVFLPQLERKIGPTVERLRAGGSLFLSGLAKKLLIADQIAPIADAVFASPASWTTGMTWAGLLAYTLQIYCDFSGYSDMAIGTAKMLGYDLPENFNMPYLAANVAEFWGRWHITLSQWLRDYLYVPLGGNRRGRARTWLNLMLTMLLGGLWHGAGWNFVLWGLLHGAALAIHRAYRATLPDVRMPRILARGLTLLFVTLCWVPFRAPDLAATRTMLASLFGFGSGRDVWWTVMLPWAVVLTVAGHLVGVLMENDSAILRRLLEKIDAFVDRGTISGPFVVLGWESTGGAFVTTAAVLIVYLFGATSTSPFIYFQF